MPAFGHQTRNLLCWCAVDGALSCNLCTSIGCEFDAIASIDLTFGLATYEDGVVWRGAQLKWGCEANRDAVSKDRNEEQHDQSVN